MTLQRRIAGTLIINHNTLRLISVMNIILKDPSDIREQLLPITYTRPVADIRVGITTLREKWERLIPGDYSYITCDYLSELFPLTADADNCDSITISADIIASPTLADAILGLADGQALVTPEGRLISVRGAGTSQTVFDGPVRSLKRLTDIFTLNGEQIADDFQQLTRSRKSASPGGGVTVVGDPTLVFIEEGATVQCCSINVTDGPVYIGKNAEVMEGSTLRGPVAVCEHSVVRMGCRIYPDTTIGPWSKVGGELSNVVIQSYSNKAHDGYLGNAVIGSWCNLGAGTTASNLKNDYTEIKLWNYPAQRFLRTGLQFCGLIMGDHSKAGVNTMFNTATVIGVGVNIHGTGFPRNFVASFSEGGTAGYTEVSMTKFFDIASRVMARRGIDLTDADRRMFMAIRDIAENYK